MSFTRTTASETASYRGHKRCKDCGERWARIYCQGRCELCADTAGTNGRPALEAEFVAKQVAERARIEALRKPPDTPKPKREIIVGRTVYEVMWP